MTVEQNIFIHNPDLDTLRPGEGWASFAAAYLEDRAFVALGEVIGQLNGHYGYASERYVNASLFANATQPPLDEGQRTWFMHGVDLATVAHSGLEHAETRLERG